MSDENPPRNPHEEFYRSVVATKSDEGAGALEKAIESERDSRREERFYWILALTIVLDVSSFQHLAWAAVTFIFLLEIIGLIGMAKWLGVDAVVVLLERIYSRIGMPRQLGNIIPKHGRSHDDKSRRRISTRHLCQRSTGPR